MKTADEYHAELMAAGAAGKSERTLNKLRIQYWLEKLVERGVLNYWNRENGRWRVDTAGSGRSARHYTTSEVEAFIHGMDSAWEMMAVFIPDHKRPDLNPAITKLSVFDIDAVPMPKEN